MTPFDTSDKRDEENWSERWARKHDERHADTGGVHCRCMWNRTGRRKLAQKLAGYKHRARLAKLAAALG